METSFGFIGWCKEDNHDKVWGYFYRPTPEADGNRWITKQYGWNCVIFWARRGKAMQFKADKTGTELDKLVRNKQNVKHYRSITPAKLFEIWPSFIQECEEKLMWDVLAGKVK